MVLFLKIISFPFRLILFLITAIISGTVSGLNHTLGLLLIAAAYIISVIGSIIMGITVIGGIVYIGGFVLYPEKFEALKGNIPFLLLSGAGLMIGCMLLILMPLLSEKLFEWSETAADWLWGLAKMILFCDIDEIKYY